MVSLIPSPYHFVGSLNFPVISRAPAYFNLVARKQNRAPNFLGFGDLKRGKSHKSSWNCLCKSWESEGDSALEAEVLEFMTKSRKPNVFPTKEELVDAGRMDLVEAIAETGGWLALGWDLDESNEQENGTPSVISDDDCDEFRPRFESFDEDPFGSPGVSTVSNNSSQSTSSSGRSLETVAEKDTGIEGILSRLEQQRNLSFGINMGKNGRTAHASKNDEDDLSFYSSSDLDSADLQRTSRLASASSDEAIFTNFDGNGHYRTGSDFDGLTNSSEPIGWRTWSLQRAGSLDTQFEAAEIYFHENLEKVKKDASRDGIREVRESAIETLDRRKEINHRKIRTRIQHLELELASALRSLRSSNKKMISKEGHESSSDEYQKLSDAWEFQENDFMNAKDRLRSIRAKLAVVEGRMALAIIDAQKVVEEKQKRINGASRALHLLSDVSIVWPTAASEVLLAGSFDGWTSQRKMEKSVTGVFSINLKLYPGKYEMKFIVDGVWKTDPLRPLVRNNGHENNLFIVTHNNSSFIRSPTNKQTNKQTNNKTSHDLNRPKTEQ